MLRNYTKEFPINLKLAYPVMIGQLGQVVVGLIDNVMVGKLGATSLAAVSLGNGLFFLTMSLAIGFSLSITPLIAQCNGQGLPEKGKVFFKNGMLLCAIIGIVLFFLIKGLQPFLSILDQPKEVVTLANPYINILAYSIIPFTLFQAIKQFSDGMSATRYAMIATVIGNLVNILLNYILIYGKFGFPKLEVEGAAIGTLISRIVMFFLLIVVLKQKSKFNYYFINFFSKLFNKEAILKLLSLGFPASLQMLFEFGIFTSSIVLCGQLSVESQAANQIALNLASMTFMVAVGLGVVTTIRVGNQLGKQHYTELVRITRSILLLIIIIEFCFAVFFLLTRNQLPQFYINDLQVVDIAAQLLLMVAWFQLSDGIQVVLLGALRGLQDVNVPTLLLFIAYWCIGFPTAYFLGDSSQLGALGVWVGLLVGLTASSILLFIRYRYLISTKFNSFKHCSIG